ncbi:MAG TPA: hypothetical protein VIW24_06210 [Aldersonia sp.]
MSEIRTDDTTGAVDVEKHDPAPNTFTVSVEGPGVQLARTVDQTTALSVITTLLGGGLPATSSSPGAPAAAPPRHLSGVTKVDGAATDGDIDAGITVGEYLDECEAQKFPAKITAIGHFLQKKLEQTYFTREEVKSQFPQAGEAPPANFSRDFNDAIAQKWIAEANEKGQYLVTRTGRNAIAAKFDKTTRRVTPTRRRRSSTAKTDSGDAGRADNADSQDLNN